MIPNVSRKIIHVSIPMVMAFWGLLFLEVLTGMEPARDTWISAWSITISQHQQLKRPTRKIHSSMVLINDPRRMFIYGRPTSSPRPTHYWNPPGLGTERIFLSGWRRINFVKPDGERAQSPWVQLSVSLLINERFDGCFESRPVCWETFTAVPASKVISEKLREWWGWEFDDFIYVSKFVDYQCG